MAKFQYQHGGYEYEIEADDEKSADEKFNQALKHFSDQEKLNKNIQESIKNEGDIKKLENMRDTTNPWTKANKAAGYIFGKGTEALESVPGLKPMRDFVSPSLMKGVPIARHYVPQTEYLSQMEKEYPKTSTGLNIVGGTGAMLPISGGIAARLAPELAGIGQFTNTPVGPMKSFLANLATQGAVNTGVNQADTLAEKGIPGTTLDDVKSNVAWGIGSAALPAALTGIFGQTARTAIRDVPRIMAEPRLLPGGAPRPRPNPLWDTLRGSEIRSSGFPSPSPEQSRAITTGLGGLAGYQLGHSPEAVIAGLLGGYGGHPLIEPFERGVARVAQHPTTQDIIRALMAQSKTETTSPTYNIGQE